jgi:predicted MFS family arabinose efflux permease
MKNNSATTATTNGVSRYAWLLVALLWVVAALNYLDRQIISTMKPPLVADLGVDNAQFGLFLSVFLWVYGFLSPLAGLAADRFNKRWLIIGSLAVWSVVTWATGHVHTFEQMLWCRALMGISEACYVPAAFALIVEQHRGPTRSLATGLHISGIYAGSMLGGVGGTLCAQLGSWRPVFWLLGGIGVGYAVLLIFFLRGGAARKTETQSAENFSPLASLRSLLTTRSFLMLLAMSAIIGAATWTLKGWLPAFFQEEMGKSQADAGWYGTLFFNGAAFTGMLIGSVISDRWSRTNLRARALVPAIAFTLAGPIFFGCVHFSQAALVVVTGILAVGFAQGCLDCNLMPTVCTLTGARQRATAYGLLNFISTITGGLMTFYAGHLKDAHVSFAATFQIAGGMIFFAGLILLAVKPTHKFET